MYTTRDIYKKIKALSEKGNLTGEITSPVYTQYLKCIKTELESSKEKDWDSAIQTLQILVDHNVLSVRRDVLDIIEDEQINPNMQERILVSVSIQCLQQYLKENNLPFVSKLYEISKKHNIDFSASLKTVLSLDVYKRCYKDLIYHVLIPTIFDKTKLDKPENLVYLDLALVFASAKPFSLWSQQKLQTFVDNIPSRVNVICELQDRKFNDWYKLWMFLVRFSGTKLHSSMTPINKLLRAAETAFRNPSDSERIKGYECWKELIINASLDLKYMASTKQLKLLLTPLKAKFSKHEVVVLKKFEVYVLLIEKLEYKAVLVLKDFLEFCFGQVSETTDPNKCGFGKTVPDLWLRMSKVFLAILGHSHNQDETCLDSSTEINLKLAVLNKDNIIECAEHAINSMAECCLCLKVVEVASERNTALKCLWKSLLNIVLLNDAREVCYPFIGKVLEKFSQNSDPYSATLSAIAFQEIVDNDSPNRASLVLNQLHALLYIVFSVPLSPECGSKVKDLLTVLRGVDSAEIQIKLRNSFVNYQMNKSNANFVADIWSFLVHQKGALDSSLDLLIWPILYIHLITDKSKEVSVYKHYKTELTPFVEKSDELHLSLFKQIVETLQNNPLLLGNVLGVLTTFQPKTKHKEITNVTLDLLICMLLIPTHTDEIAIHRDSIESYIKKLFENGLLDLHEFDSIKKICTCVELLLKIKRYDVLEYLDQSFGSFPESVKMAYSKNLKLVTLTNICDAETNVEKQTKIQKIITALRNAKAQKNFSSVMTVGGRSAKIANLVKQLPSSTLKPETNQSPLRLFGKDIETHTPLKPVAGSQRNKSTPNKSTPVSKPTSASKIKPLIDEESSSKFVLIESEVKLDKTKLTEHQKEVLTKRREDIPALYQDLSQSVTQSLDSSDAFAAKPDTTNQNEEDDKTLELKKKKFEAEMKKLSMNLVGADKFLSPGTKRKRSATIIENEPKRKAEEQSVTPEEKKRKRSKTPKSKMTKLVSGKRDRSKSANASTPTPAKNDNTEITQKKRKGRSKSTSSLTEKTMFLNKFLLSERSSTSNFPVTAEDDMETELFGSEANLQDTHKTINEPEKAKKKLHLSGSEEDDVIESSQDTTLLNSRWSLNKTKRNSSIDMNPIDQSAKENSDDINFVTFRRHKKDANPMTLKQDEQKLIPVVNLENINVSPIEDRKSGSSEKRTKHRTESTERRKSPRTHDEKPQGGYEVTKKASLTFICTNSESNQEADISNTDCDLDLTDQTLSQVDVIHETHAEPTNLLTDNEIRQKSTQSQDTETIGTESLETDQEAVPLLDLPQKLPLTESEQDMAEMDTASFTSVHSSECTVIKKNETSEEVIETASADIPLTQCDDVQNEEVEAQRRNKENEMSAIKDLLLLNKCEVLVEDILSPHKRIPVENCAATPDRRQASLPSSPVTVDTPNRTSELLTSTSDISPIASTQSSSEEEEPKKLVPIVLNFDCDEDEPEKTDETSSENNPELIQIQEEQVISSPPKSEDIAEHFKDTLCKKFVRSRGIRSIARNKCRSVLSPSASRIKKLMSKFKPNSKTDSLEEDYSKEDVLTFSREVPSPLAIPRSSILKRKHPDTPEDGTLPSAKRKRVNFSDPCISSKKLFIREEALPLSYELGEVSDADIDQQLLEVLNFGQEKNDVSTTNSSSITENNIPIYPLLVDCKGNVHDFLKWGFEDMDNNLRSKLNKGNVKTIGDLARQSENSIEKLSISTREQLMLVEMLDSYHKKQCSDENELNGNTEVEREENEMESPLDLAKRMLQKIDVKLELDQTVEKVKRQGIPLDTLFSVVLGSANQTDVLTWVKSHFRLQTVDLLEEKDFPTVLQHISHSLGFEEVFKSLEKISKKHYNAAIDKRLQEKPLSDIVAARSAEELSSALSEDRNIHIKKEIVDKFLQQATSAELVPFFSQSSLSGEGYVDFIKAITASSENVKKTVLDQCSDSELIAELLKRRSVESLTSELFDQLTKGEKKDLIVLLVKSL